jgi:WD40 repeat protein
LPSNQKHKIFAHQNETTCVVYDPLGNKLATGGGDHLIKIWDPNSGKSIFCNFILGKNTAILKGFQKAVTSLSFNLEGSVIAGGSVQKTVKLFSLKTHRELHTFTGHKGSF